MFLKRLFGRKKTDAQLALDRAQLIEVALTDPDSANRRDACHALNDLATLRRVAEDDGNAGLRDLAGARYRKLLCGIDEQAPPLAERLQELKGAGDEAALAHCARHGSEPELRLAAIEALQSQQALADCAVDDPLAANRLSAAERLQDRDALEQVARRIGKRDKRVYRLARERLKAIGEREQRPRLVRAQCDALCERLERLGRFDNWVQDHALLMHLDQQWAEIEPEVEPADRARFQGLRQSFIEAYDAYSEQHAAQLAEQQARGAAAERRAQLVGALREACELPDLDALDRRLAEIEQEWQETTNASAGDAHAGAHAKALEQVREHRRQLAEQRRQGEAAASLLQEAKALLAASGEVDRQRLKQLRKRLERIQDPGANTAVVAECTAVLDQVTQRIEKHRAQIARKLAALPERLQALDQHFEQGRLKRAEPLYQSIAATLEQARAAGLPQKDLDPTEAHLKQIAPQLRELQRWRRWGADNQRESLCAEMETLAADEQHALEPLTIRLRELQDSWRRLDRTGAPADDALWQRFHAAAERVHEHALPFLEAQAKVRAAKRAQREAICEQLETFLEQVDWARMDWKKATRAEREMRQAWAALGPVDGREHKPLEGRFRKAIRRLDKALNAEREQNMAAKRDLIAQMEALVDEPDLGRAIDAAKRLQHQWHTTVPGRQRDENALWQAFRAASDQVFARREAQNEARNAELRENQATREAICDELAELGNTASSSAALRAALHTLEQRWQTTQALPLPRTAAQSLERRWRDVQTAARQQLRSLQEAERWAAIARLERRALWCDSTARRVIAAPEAVDPEILEQQWAGLPTIDDPALMERLQAAFSLVKQAATDSGVCTELGHRMRENAERRRDLCLHLEITAGAESPPELRQQRMELQVTRLREHMGEGEVDPVGDGSRLLQDWYLCAPAAAVDGLDARFDRAKRALMGAQPAPEAA
jgi:exonuclease SbcC